VIYLDANATTPPLPEVVDAVARSLEATWANPSSIHRPGQAARHAVELARADVARLIGCSEREIVFTSGGTEAADLAIRGAMAASGRRLLVTSRLEHAAVRDLAKRLQDRGEAEVLWLEHDAQGRVRPESLQTIVRQRRGEIALVSVMAANNETGALQSISELAAIARQAGVPFHTDATQVVGRMPVRMPDLGVDLLSCSAHKLHGPKGVGALYVRRGVELEPLLRGGPQEQERRGGTENVPGIVGFGKAAALAREWLDGGGPQRLASLRDRLENELLRTIEGTHVHGRGAPRVCNTSNLRFDGISGEALVALASDDGLCVSTGAACSASRHRPSHVLLAMGLSPAEASSSVRLSLSRYTTEAEVQRALEVLSAAVRRLRALLGAMPAPR